MADFFSPFFLQKGGKAVILHRVFHSIKFKVKGWDTAVSLFLCLSGKQPGV